MTREQKVEEAKRLRATGLTYHAIGGTFGVTTTTARRWCNPELMERDRELTRQYFRNPINKERQRERQRKYQQTAECKEYQRQYFQANKERIYKYRASRVDPEIIARREQRQKVWQRVYAEWMASKQREARDA
ncbi:hypothetical protein [Lacipirellula sp.]|uniref:hypothetical protein n=1 Tax=Lacipirellula sp. TaxID=2691419 RepID=UPI003D1287FF